MMGNVGWKGLGSRNACAGHHRKAMPSDPAIRLSGEEFRFGGLTLRLLVGRSFMYSRHFRGGCRNVTCCDHPPL